MNLQELQENKKTKLVKRALKEHFEMKMDFDKLSLSQTSKMLARVRNLLSETRSTKKIHSSHTDSSYLKLVMMEQALQEHFSALKVERQIFLENEEVQKSQVILAAQDMIDSVQKMLEQISKMNVEELPAVVDGIKNEFGTNEGEQFNTSVSEVLQTLQTGLSTAKQGLSGALGTITGEGGAGFDAAGQPGMGEMPMEPSADMGADMGVGMDAGMEMGAEEQPELPAPEPEEAEPEDATGAGRGRR
jgi:hypothetical protein